MRELLLVNTNYNISDRLIVRVEQIITHLYCTKKKKIMACLNIPI
jgi:hypothetical protein